MKTAHQILKDSETMRARWPEIERGERLARNRRRRLMASDRDKASRQEALEASVRFAIETAAAVVPVEARYWSIA